MIYGILIGAKPMIVANFIVATLAIASAYKQRPRYSTASRSEPGSMQ